MRLEGEMWVKWVKWVSRQKAVERGHPVPLNVDQWQDLLSNWYIFHLNIVLQGDWKRKNWWLKYIHTLKFVRKKFTERENLWGLMLPRGWDRETRAGGRSVCLEDTRDHESYNGISSTFLFLRTDKAPLHWRSQLVNNEALGFFFCFVFVLMFFCCFFLGCPSLAPQFLPEVSSVCQQFV